MDCLDGFIGDIDYDEVRSIFGKIYEEWDEKSRSGMLAPIAALGDTAFGLRWAADQKYLIAGALRWGRVRIALFGHTHEYEIKKGLLLKPQPASAKAHACRSMQREVIYGNCGTWIDTKDPVSCTFIVTEKITVKGERRINVRGYSYDKSGVSLQNDDHIVL